MTEYAINIYESERGWGGYSSLETGRWFQVYP